MAYVLAFVACLAGAISVCLDGRDAYHVAIWVTSAASALVAHRIISR